MKDFYETTIVPISIVLGLSLSCASCNKNEAWKEVELKKIEMIMRRDNYFNEIKTKRFIR